MGLTPSINADAAEQARLAAALDRALPESHREFLGNLKSSFTCGDFFFVHAGVRPGIPLAKQREEDLLWIRQDFLFVGRGLQQDHRSRAHARAAAGDSLRTGSTLTPGPMRPDG